MIKGNPEAILSDEEIRKLVLARLSVLSSETVISLGSEGSFTRDELVERVEKGDAIGEKLAEIQMAWLQSFKSELTT
jgi:predicted transcriptional regulator